jgi:DMSO/TMAO reductase YedYZ molybdopterin-dependent catalytic subunit
MPITRGFKGRQLDTGIARDRIPPGQYVTSEFPILTAGPTQHTPLESWSLMIQRGEDVLAQWSWGEFESLPQTERTTDIHCVTKWTKFDTRWRGVTFDDLLKAAGVSATTSQYVMAYCDGGYATNLPIVDLVDGRAMIATHFDNLPISASHGGPARLLVPHLYLWKSAKWVRRLVFMDANVPGFWESMGYHIHGDPWREQRYADDV